MARSYPTVKYRVRKIYHSLSESQVRQNFEMFKNFEPGTSSTKIDSYAETLEDGSRVAVGYILERIKVTDKENDE